MFVVANKHPAVFPFKHPVTRLIIKDFYEKEGHVGVNHVLAEINIQYWILKGRSAVKKVLKACLTCEF